MAEDKSRFHNVHGYLKMAFACFDQVCNSKVSISNERISIMVQLRHREVKI